MMIYRSSADLCTPAQPDQAWHERFYTCTQDCVAGLCALGFAPAVCLRVGAACGLCAAACDRDTAALPLLVPAELRGSAMVVFGASLKVSASANTSCKRHTACLVDLASLILRQPHLHRSNAASAEHLQRMNLGSCAALCPDIRCAGTSPWRNHLHSSVEIDSPQHLKTLLFDRLPFDSKLNLAQAFLQLRSPEGQRSLH